MNFFCLKCNQSTPCSMGVVPKFCSTCGSPFAQSSTSSLPASTPKKVEIEKTIIPKRKPTRQTEEIEDNDESIDIDLVKSVSSIEIEPIRVDLRGTEKLGTLASGTKSTEKIERVKPPKMSKKKFWEEFRKESSSARKKAPIEIN